MTTAKKIAEAGWFYNAPAKSMPRDEPVAVPPASQIPGLSDLSDVPYEQEPRKNVITEADSPYVRLAKMGGRPDLLRVCSPKPKSDEAKPYPRNDWFYMEDIAMEDNCQDKEDSDYVFTLPHYMVNKDTKSMQNKQAGDAFTPARLPYAFDKTTVYEREGEDATNKKLAIEEIRPHGYGIRAEKQHGKPVKAQHPMPVQERGKAPAPQYDYGIPKVKPMKEMAEDPHPPMTKILSHGYAKDWDQERDKWEMSHKKADPREKVMPSEYQSSMAAGTPPVRSANSHRTSAGSKKSAVKKSKSTEQEKKELFKLSKFTRVPGRTDSGVNHNSNTTNNINSNSSNNNNMSSSAPFATSASSTGGDEQKGGRRKYDSSSQRSDAPFATNYPETSDIDFRDQEGTPSSKHGGRRRYDDQDAAHEAPFAIASGEPMFEEPPHAPAENNNAAPAAGQTGRPQPIKPSDNRDVFRYDQSASEEEASRSGRRRYQQEKHDAPFATSGGAEADRQVWNHQAQQNMEVKNVPARTNTNSSASASNIAGSRKNDRNVPPPNSSGEGKDNRSQMRDCPFALN